MKQAEILQIQYTKATNIGGQKGEVTERTIIPTFVPQPNMKALDITQLTEEQQAQMQQWYKEYTEYFKFHMQRAYSFEDWLSHTETELSIPEIKWRTFKLDNVEVLT